MEVHKIFASSVCLACLFCTTESRVMAAVQTAGTEQEVLYTDQTTVINNINPIPGGGVGQKHLRSTFSSNCCRKAAINYYFNSLKIQSSELIKD